MLFSWDITAARTNVHFENETYVSGHVSDDQVRVDDFNVLVWGDVSSSDGTSSALFEADGNIFITVQTQAQALDVEDDLSDIFQRYLLGWCTHC